MLCFFSFIESITTHSTVDDLMHIVTGYCVSHGLDHAPLTESWQDFARKHGNKVKAFMAGLMLLASVANAGTGQHIKTGDIHIKSQSNIEMSSGDANGVDDAQKLLKLLTNQLTKKQKPSNHCLMAPYKAMMSRRRVTWLIVHYRNPDSVKWTLVKSTHSMYPNMMASIQPS